MKKPVIIFGTSDLGQTVDFYFSKDSDYTVAAFAASREAIAKNGLTEVRGKPVIAFEDIEKTHPPSKYDLFVAVGYAKMNDVKERNIGEAEAKGYALPSYICSRAGHWGDVTIGANVFIQEMTNIQQNVTIGKGVIIGRGNNIGHDSVIEDYAFIANHAVLCGHNIVGKSSFIGSNATVMDGVKVAPKTLVGAAAFINSDTHEGDAFLTPETKRWPNRAATFFSW